MKQRTASPVADFVVRFLQKLGVRVEPTEKGLRVELTTEQLQLLYGRPLWGWQRPPGELTTIYMRFDDGEKTSPTKAQRDADTAELVTRGSHRLDQLAAAALRIAGVGQTFVTGPGVRPEFYRPHLVFHYVLTYMGRDQTERIQRIVVDLVTGRGRPWTRLPTGFTTTGQPAGEQTEAPSVDLGTAHEAAVKVLRAIVAREDATWHREQSLWQQVEVARLYDYVRETENGTEEGASSDADDILRAGRVRLMELKRLAGPRLEARARAATVLYLPIVRRRDGILFDPILQQAIGK